MAKRKPNEQASDGRNTPEMLTVAEGAKLPMTQEIAVDMGKDKFSSLTAKMGLPKGTEWFVIQHGQLAFRDGEPAKIVGFTHFNPATKKPMFCAVLKYADTGPFYVDMHLPHYAMGTEPPWIFSRTVKDPDGHERVERRSDKQHWLELVPANCIRHSYKVKG